MSKFSTQDVDNMIEEVLFRERVYK